MRTSEKTPTLVFIPCFSGAPWSAEQLAPYGDAPKRTLRLPEGVDDIERYADHVESAVADLFWFDRFPSCTVWMIVAIACTARLSKSWPCFSRCTALPSRQIPRTASGIPAAQCRFRASSAPVA
ncbi:hypothetical protein [Kitasatospora aureofaciens]|uniref:hypothetical protein n=1 Tax=Kitasatospora aureofaciens TaxID=1894 RepID=UPI0033E6973C